MLFAEGSKIASSAVRSLMRWPARTGTTEPSSETYLS